MRVCSPHCGIDPETTSGGETYERELVCHLGALGHSIELLLARHKRYPEGVTNWTIHRLPVRRGLRWPVAALPLPRYVPIVAHDHHLDPSWLNPAIEERVVRAADRVVVRSEFGHREATERRLARR